MMHQPMKICILGGGFGGLYSALYLSRSKAYRSGKCQITLVEQREHFLFTPLLYELVTHELERWEIAPSYQKLLFQTQINFLQNTITSVDFEQQNVRLENGEYLTYDRLVLAAGMQTRWPPIPGLKNHALTFRTLEDVDRLLGKLRELENSERKYLRLAIIGAGPSGVEIACKLADRLGKLGQVWLLELGNEILTGFSPGVRRAAYRALGLRRIQVMLKTGVETIDAESLTFSRNGQSQTIPIDLILWTAGTEARSWISALNCQKSQQGKLLTHPTLQLLDYPDVFALGDVGEVQHSQTRAPATAQAAYQQAATMAANLQAIMSGDRLKPFRYQHLGDMLTLGDGAGIVSSFGLNIDGKLGGIIRRIAYIFRMPTARHRWQVLKNFLKKLRFSLAKKRRKIGLMTFKAD